MLLKELKEGQRFEFTDKQTALHYAAGRHFIGSTGTFKYIGVSDQCPVILVERTGEQIRVVSGTYQRDVLIIF